MIDVQVGLFRAEPAAFEAEAVIARIEALTAKVHKVRAPVFVIQHDGEPDGDCLGLAQVCRRRPGPVWLLTHPNLASCMCGTPVKVWRRSRAVLDWSSIIPLFLAVRSPPATSYTDRKSVV